MEISSNANPLGGSKVTSGFFEAVNSSFNLELQRAPFAWDSHCLLWELETWYLKLCLLHYSSLECPGSTTHVLSCLCEPRIGGHQAPRFTRHSWEKGTVRVLAGCTGQDGGRALGNDCWGRRGSVVGVPAPVRARPFLQHIHASSSHACLSLLGCLLGISSLTCPEWKAWLFTPLTSPSPSQSRPGSLIPVLTLEFLPLSQCFLLFFPVHTTGSPSWVFQR